MFPVLHIYRKRKKKSTLYCLHGEIEVAPSPSCYFWTFITRFFSVRVYMHYIWMQWIGLTNNIQKLSFGFLGCLNTSYTHLCWREGCSTIVFMMSGINSATSLCTCCLYNWYMSTTMIGSSARTLSDRSAFGMRLY